MRERTGPMAAEECRSIPAQLSRATGPIFTRGQEIAAVAQKLPPSVPWDVGERAMVVEARDPVDPTGRNATCSHIGVIRNGYAWTWNDLWPPKKAAERQRLAELRREAERQRWQAEEGREADADTQPRDISR
jgi:hypothetical protein